ncbi:MAG TPA: di-trans,poly-cis-decaprenylcistransferase [Longimicrobiales bacterium]|nr:di-trans,poly-cis-decaprenylcistransferase [Longimicrobiales bacterium]
MKSEPGPVFLSEPSDRFHLAIIMDGNGRWATARGRPRELGHRQGALAVRRVVEAAPGAGVGLLTLYAFSSDNWKRPAREVRALMSLFRRYLRSEASELRDQGVRLQVIGRRDRLPRTVVSAIEEAEATTAGGARLLLRLAVDYSSRQAVLEAARRCAVSGGVDPARFAIALSEAIHGSTDGAPDVDLMIRTGGEQRLSDFLLWECAYAELVFTPRMWPDFSGEDLEAAVSEFRRRDRRFGAVAAAV